MPIPFRHASLLFAALLLAGTLAACGDAIQGAQNASGVQQAVRQQYDAENVDVTLHQGEGAPRLEIALVNPGGQEATNRRTAREVAQTARAQYGGGSLAAVMVSFEYTSMAGQAEVGFHRRYTFSSSDLQAAASDTAAADTTSAASPADTSADSQP